jgi:hypothetical protein
MFRSMLLKKKCIVHRLCQLTNQLAVSATMVDALVPFDITLWLLPSDATFVIVHIDYRFVSLHVAEQMTLLEI